MNATLLLPSTRQVQGPFDSLGREVVGRLNGEGGRILIDIDSIRRPELLDHFLRDSIEPVPTKAEVSLEVTEHGRERALHIAVNGEGSRRPYAFVHGLVREFLKLEGDRVRPLRIEEILASRAVSGLQDSGVNHSSDEKRLSWMNAGRRGLWLRFNVHPAPDGAAPSEDLVSAVFIDEPLPFERPTWNLHPLYHFGFGKPPRWTESAYVFESGAQGDRRWVQVEPQGSVSFFAEHPPKLGDLESNELSGWLITLYVVSALRRVSRLYRELPPGNSVVRVEFNLFEIADNTLEPEAPWHRIPWTVKQGRAFEGRHLEPPAGLEFSVEELLQVPDECAFRVVRRIYAVFGFRETAIPWFDAQTRRFDRPG
jgi:hypothetical protein